MSKLNHLRKFDRIPDDETATSTTSTAETQTQTVNANGGGDAKFTQADLDRIAGETRKEAKRVAVNELLKELGFEKPDELKSLVTQARKQKDAEKTELQKAIDDRTALEKERDELKAKFDQKLISDAFREAAKDWTHPELAIKFADDLSEIKIEDGKVIGVEDVVKALTKKYPDQVKRADDSHADIDGKKRSQQQAEPVDEATLREEAIRLGVDPRYYKRRPLAA